MTKLSFRKYSFRDTMMKKIMYQKLKYFLRKCYVPKINGRIAFTVSKSYTFLKHFLSLRLTGAATAPPPISLGP